MLDSLYKEDLLHFRPSTALARPGADQQQSDPASRDVFDTLDVTMSRPGGVELMPAHSHLGEHSGSGIGKKREKLTFLKFVLLKVNIFC